MLSSHSAALASLLTIATVLPSRTVARAWPWGSSTRPILLSEKISNSQDILSANEINALFLNLQTLDAYTQRPDCFRNTVVALRNRCGEAEMTRSERVGAAISMTLCELATAKHHSPPLECFPFSSPSHEGEEVDEETQSICVGALSRSAQFWSSYSGYLREVRKSSTDTDGLLRLLLSHKHNSASRTAVGTTLVFGNLLLHVRLASKFSGTDTSKSIYLNATLEKLALIRLLKQREARMTTLAENWAENISDLRTVSGDIHTQLFEYGERFRHLLVDMDSTVLQFQETMDDFFNSAQKKHNMEIDRHTSQVQSLLRHAAEAHTESLFQVVASMDASLSSRIEDMHDIALKRVDNLFLSLFQLDEHWERISHEITNLSRNVIDIADITSRTAVQLKLNLETIFSQQHLQLQALNAVHNLTRTVTVLSSVAHSEMQRLNETARGLHFHLSPPLYLPMHWLKSCARFLIGAYLDHLSGLPVLHFLIKLLSVLWSLLQLFCSLLMSFFIVRVSSKMGSKVECPQAEPRTLVFDRVATITPSRYPASPPRRFVSRIPARLYMPTSASCAG